MSRHILNVGSRYSSEKHDITLANKIESIHINSLTNESHVKENAARLDTIATNTANIKISTDSVNLNVDTLETLTTATNAELQYLNNVNTAGATAHSLLAANVHHNDNKTHLAGVKSEIQYLNNTGAAGSLAHSLLAGNVHHDDNKTHLAGIKTAIELLDNCVDGNELQVDIISSALPSGGATSANQVIIEASLTAMEAKMDVDNVVYDNQLIKLTEIDTAIDTIDTVLDASLVKQTNNETLLTSIDQKLGDIETAVQILDNAIAGNEMQVDIISIPTTTVSGTVTANLSATDNAVLDDVSQKLGDIETAVQGTLTVGSHAVTNAGTFAVQAACSGTVTANLGATDNAVLDDISQKLGDIETAVQILDNAIAGNEMQVDVISMPSTTVSGTVTANLSATDNAVLDAMVTDLAAIEVTQGTIAGDTTSIDGKITACNTGAVVLAAGSATIGTVTANLGSTDNAVLDDIAQKLGDIETAVQILDNAISGNEMQVDIVSIPTTTVSGTVTANLSATDNAVLDAIETTNNAIQSAVEGTLTVGSHAVTNAGTFAVQAACSGTVTANLSATDNAVLDASLVKQTNIETLITTLDGVQDNVLTKITNNETLLTAIDSDTNAIKVSAAALVVDAAATEVLITATNGLLTTLDGVQDNVLTKITNNETLLTAIDEDTNNIKTSTASCATDLAALEVLQTATNGLLTTLDGVQDNVLAKITNNETLLTAIDADTSSMNTDLQAIETSNAAILAKLSPVKSVSVSHSNVTVSDGGSNTSSAIDVRTVKHLGFSGSASDDGGGSIKILASATSGGTYLEVGSGTFNTGALQVAAIPNAPYHYIKIQIDNNTGSSPDYTVNVFKSS